MTTQAPEPGHGRSSPGLLRRVGFALRHAGREMAALVRPYAREPVIVLGNQKSGTSAIAALVAARAGLDATIDLEEEVVRPTFQHVTSGRLSFEQFARVNKLDLTRPVIKEPNLTFLYPQLRSFFPAARFLFVVRDPRHNIRSILNRLDLPGDPTAADADHLQRISTAWRLVLDGRWLGITGDTYVEQLANRWNMAADVYFDHVDEMTLITYESFLDDKAGCIDRLVATAGLTPRRDVTAQLDRPFQPAGDRTVALETFFGDPTLRRVESICRERMTRFGYATSP